MKAVYINDPSPNAAVSLCEVDEPASPLASQVLVRVRAAGLNRADLMQVKGLYPPPPGVSPNIPGLEFAGEVTEVGSDVTQWSGGERVFGITAGEAQVE